MEKYFYLQDAAFTEIQIKSHKASRFIVFRTYDNMFDTINSALYEMLTLYEIYEEMLEERLNNDRNGYGWDFSEDILPFVKQIIYKAVDAHDLRALEDKPAGRRNIQKEIQIDYDYYIIAKAGGELPQKVATIQKIARNHKNTISTKIKHLLQRFIKKVLRY